MIEVSVDLRSMFGEVRNQGSRPTCVAFAASDTHAGLRDGWTPLSCEYVFYHAQKRAKRSPQVGALLTWTLEALREVGQPFESGWGYLAYTPDEASWHPPSDVGKVFGRAGRVIELQVDKIISELDEGRPVIALTMVSPAFYAPAPDGVVRPAPGENLQTERRHAVVAVGHGRVDGKTAVLVRNSWGPRWGEKGYAWLFKSYLDAGLFGAATLLEATDVYSTSKAA